ncbi:hypothetical protein D3C87_1580130 [compost metagenome]
MRLAAGIKTHLDGAQVQFPPIGPDAPHHGRVALAQPDGEIGEVAEGLDLRAAIALAAATRHLDAFLKARRPDQRTADPRRAVKPVDGRAFVRTRNTRCGKPGAGHRPPVRKQRAVDGIARQRASRAADDGTHGAENAAECCTRRLKENGRHGRLEKCQGSGKRKTPAIRRFHPGTSAERTTAACL